MLPWPVWPLAGQSGLGQNTVARSMSILLALSSGLPRVWLDLRFCYKSASPRFSAELPIEQVHRNTGLSLLVIGQKTQTVLHDLPHEYGQLHATARPWEALIAYLYTKY